jgi:hypothetical protein
MNNGMMEYKAWSIGVTEYWNIGALEYWVEFTTSPFLNSEHLT